MRNKYLFTVWILLFTVIFFSACRKNGDAASSNPETSSVPASLEAADSSSSDESVNDKAESGGNKTDKIYSSASAAAASKSDNPKTPERFDSSTISYIGSETAAVFSEESTTTSAGEIKYCLYTPKNPQKNMPLIIYLHGGTSKGDDLNKLTEIDGFPQYLKNGELGDVRAYVIMPQLTSDKKGWTDISAGIREIIGKAADLYGIDKTNVSLTGHSMGGTGTWGLAAANSDLFRRIAPLSGSITLNEKNVNALKSVSVRAFVGANDTIVKPQSSKAFVAALKKAGGNAEITEFEGADHFAVPKLTYCGENINLIDWLIGK